MRRPARKVTYMSVEARERISRANEERWRDPEYRERHTARLAQARKKHGNFGGFKRGHKHSQEVIEKIRATSQERWRDPEYRARHLVYLQEAAKKGLAASNAVRRCRPPEGTPEAKLYEKVRRALGVEAARSLNFSAETDGAGAP